MKKFSGSEKGGASLGKKGPMKNGSQGRKRGKNWNTNRRVATYPPVPHPPGARNRKKKNGGKVLD